MRATLTATLPVAADCHGARSLPCGAAGVYEGGGATLYTVASPPPAASTCRGGGAARCDERLCKPSMHTTYCLDCTCFDCPYCYGAGALRAASFEGSFHAIPDPPSPPPPPPSPSPPVAFTCGMLRGMKNVRFGAVPAWCYDVPKALCTRSYTFEQRDGDNFLSMCVIGANGECASYHIDNALFVGHDECARALASPPTPPSPPPGPPQPAHPPTPPSPPPSPSPPPFPPPPAPCVPPSAQCGGRGWTGSTTCCGGSSCFEKSSSYSQCRPECDVADWACTRPPPPPSPSPPPTSPSPPPSPPPPHLPQKEHHLRAQKTAVPASAALAAAGGGLVLLAVGVCLFRMRDPLEGRRRRKPRRLKEEGDAFGLDMDESHRGAGLGGRDTPDEEEEWSSHSAGR